MKKHDGLGANPLLPHLSNIDVDNLDDDYIVKLMLEEAELKKELVKRVGVVAYSSSYRYAILMTASFNYSEKGAYSHKYS